MSASITFRHIIDDETRRLTRQMKRSSVLAATQLRNAAIEVLAGSRGGRKYRVPGTKKYYTASAPGQPPAVRTGSFRNSWKPSAFQAGDTYVSRIESSLLTDNGGYLLGEILENGTSCMAARPYAEKIKQQAMPHIVQIYSAPY